MNTPTRGEVETFIAVLPKVSVQMIEEDWVLALAKAYLAQEEELREAIKEAAKWRRIRKPTHGSCCTCQGCGLHHDECRCDLEEVCDELDQLKAENQALKAEREKDIQDAINEYRGDLRC